MEGGLEEASRAAEVWRRKRAEKMLSEARIDLRAAHAAKFLLQAMPWELTPPFTPPKTPAAVPLSWEEAPGKPKADALRVPSSLALQLPPRLLAVPPAPMTVELVSCPSHSSGRASYSPHAKGCGSRGRKNSHSRHLLPNLSSSSRQYSPEKYTPAFNAHGNAKIQKPETQGSYQGSPVSPLRRSERSYSSSPSSDPFDNSPTNSFAYKAAENKATEDHHLPSPYIGSFTPLTSPYRDFSPTGNDFENRLGMGAMVKALSKAKTWSPWAKPKQNKGLLPMEPWAPTLATYLHRLDQSKENCVISDFLLGKEEGRFILGGTCGNGHVERNRDGTLHYKIAADTSPQDPIKLEEMPEKMKHCRGLPRKAGRIFGRLRRSVRFFAAIYRAIKRSLLCRKAYEQKLRWDSKLLQYQSLRELL